MTDGLCLQDASNRGSTFFDRGNNIVDPVYQMTAWEYRKQNGIDAWLINQKALQLKVITGIPSIDQSFEDEGMLLDAYTSIPYEDRPIG